MQWVWEGLQSQLIPHPASKDAFWEKPCQCHTRGKALPQWSDCAHAPRAPVGEGLFERKHRGKSFARENIHHSVWLHLPERDPTRIFTVRKIIAADHHCHMKTHFRKWPSLEPYSHLRISLWGHAPRNPSPPSFYLVYIAVYLRNFFFFSRENAMRLLCYAYSTLSWIT